MDKNYELTVYTQVINKYLDEIILITEESLKFARANRDHIVWNLTTKIYTQSGHKVELTVIRDIVNSRIEDLSYKLDAEQKRIKIEEARKTQEADRIEQLRIAEKNCLYTRHKHKIEEAQRIVDKEGLAGKFEGDQNKAALFVIVRSIVSEQICLEKSEIILESSFRDDLGVDYSDSVELIMALEEVFEIEVPDEDSDDIRTVGEAVDYIYKVIVK